MKFAPTTRREKIRAASIVAFFVLFVGGGLAYFALVVSNMPGESFEGPVVANEADIERAERMREVIEHLAAHIGMRDVFYLEGLEAARANITERFEEMGYEVVQRTYEVNEGPVTNIEAFCTGQTSPDEIVIVGAHYDTAPGTYGANDNASGVAAMLELAREFQGCDVPRTLRFVAFVNEEPPFFDTEEMGSAVYAREAHERGETIAAMIALETLGFYSDDDHTQDYPPPFGFFYPSTGNFAAFVGNVDSRAFVRWSVNTFRESGRVPSEGAAAPGRLPGIFWSDHAPFWKYDWPALMVTDTAPFRYEHYHRTSDTPGKIDYQTMAVVVDGLIPVVAGLVAADAPTF